MGTLWWVILGLIVLVLLLVAGSDKKKRQKRGRRKTASVSRSRGGVRRPAGVRIKAQPKKAVSTVIANYEALSEQAIADVEHDLLQFPQLEGDRSLLYALRVSKCVPTLRTLKTLASRWSTANCGAGTYGLQLGKQSRHWQQTYDFLAHMYAKRLDELIVELVAKAEDTASQRKTDVAKRNVWQRTYGKVEEAIRDFDYSLPQLKELGHKWLTYLDKEAEAKNTQ